MEILHISNNLTDRDSNEVKKTIYNLTSAGLSEKAIDHVGETVSIEAWVHFKQDRYDGAKQEVLAFITTDGEIFGTISTTFINRFIDIYTIFGDDIPDIEILSATSKSGNQFVTCRPV